MQRLVAPTLLSRKSDAELAALVAAGDDAAFTTIVLRHRPRLLRHCLAVLRDQRAEDAVQQTFVRALQALQSGTEVRELRPWLHRIAHNVALSELAARGSDHAELDEDWEDYSRSDEYERRATLRQALSAVEALPDRQRAALVRSAAGDSPAAIARDLGLTTVAARQLLHRARVSVRAAVRVICPPPLFWLFKRITAIVEKVPRGAGVPAGGAPVVTKIVLAVVATATVAAPVTVIHSVLSHHRPSRVRHTVAARTPVLTTSVQAPATAGPASPTSTTPAPPPPSPSAPRSTSRTPTAGPAGSGVSASSPDSAPVGAGASTGDSSTGSPVAAGSASSDASGSSTGGLGPTSTATASSPTQPAASGDSGATTTPSSGPSSTDSSSAGGSTDPSAASTDTTTSSGP